MSDNPKGCTMDYQQETLKEVSQRLHVEAFKVRYSPVKYESTYVCWH